jgi:biotin operon repressor
MSTYHYNLADLAHLLKVIGDETRLRILGAIADQPRTGKDLAQLTGLSAATISHHMRKLVDAGIVLAETDAQRQWYTLNTELLRATRATPLTHPSAGPSPIAFGEDEDGAFRRKVIRDFFDGERLTQIPAQRKRRVIVLQHLLTRFRPGQPYTEPEVNAILRRAHDDVATLRRELVDYGYLERDRGIYQMTRGAPARGATVAQEITGDEHSWLAALLEGVLKPAT